MDKLLTPIQSIRKKCLNCSNGQYSEVRECHIENCALYPYRMGKRPTKKLIEQLYQEEAY